MKILFGQWDGTAELGRLERIVLHARCLCRDHKYAWHLAGIWREVIAA